MDLGEPAGASWSYASLRDRDGSMAWGELNHGDLVELLIDLPEPISVESGMVIESTLYPMDKAPITFRLHPPMGAPANGLAKFDVG